MKGILYKDYYLYANFNDIFNKYRNYDLEGKYLLDMLQNRKRVLDIGCGTGTHLNILNNLGYIVGGIDISPKMLAVAKTKVKCPLYEASVLDFKLEEKFNAIICMKSVLNHLKSYDEFKLAIKNMLFHLEKGGMIIIDLDNKRVNGTVEDKVDGNKRILELKYDKNKEIQYRKISFFIGTKKFEMEHRYLIYNPKKLEEILNEFDIKYVMLTNYIKQSFSIKQKRMQIIIKKL